MDIFDQTYKNFTDEFSNISGEIKEQFLQKFYVFKKIETLIIIDNYLIYFDEQHFDNNYLNWMQLEN